jgi:hypothetical protein
MAATSLAVAAWLPAQAADPSAKPTLAKPDIAYADFEDETLGSFLTGDRSSNIGKPDLIDILADPTGKRGGKVVRLYYSAKAGTDRAIQSKATPSIGFRGEFYLAGWVYMPRPNSATLSGQRKIFYPQNSGNDPHALLSSWGVRDASGVWYQRPQLFTRTAEGKSRILNAGRIDFDTWTHVELQVSLNSAVDAADGVLRLWIKGEAGSEMTDAVVYNDPSKTAPWNRYFIGNQAQNADGTATGIDEYRYWDNCAVSTQRIGVR